MPWRNKVFPVLLIASMLSLSSCTVGFESFFETDTKWKSDDGRLIVNAEGLQDKLCYGEIEINGAFVPAVCNFFHTSLFVTLEDGSESQWSLKRISSGNFSYTDDSFNMTNTLNNTGDPSWDGSSNVMTGAAVSDAELDAKYFYCTSFSNADIGVRLDFLVSPDESGRTSAFTYKLFGEYGGSDITFSFGDDDAFAIEDGASHSSVGTYSTRPDGMDLSFTTDEIFALQGQSMALSIVS